MMSRFGKWLPTMLIVAGFAFLGVPRDAHALLVLEGTITVDGNAPITVYATDNNVPYPTVPPPGGIQLIDTNNAVGQLDLAPGTIPGAPGYSVSSSSNFDSQALNNNSIFSNALQIVNNTGSTVTTNIAVGDNNFVGPATTANFSASGTWTNADGSVYNTFFYDDPNNAQPLASPNYINSIAGLIGQLTHTVSGVADSYGSGPQTAAVNDPSNFAMTLRFNFTLVNGGTFVSRGQNELKTGVVPEPAPIALALAGLPVLGLIWSRRRRPQA